jgi:hypothetical protein
VAGTLPWQATLCRRRSGRQSQEFDLGGDLLRLHQAARAPRHAGADQ